MKDQSRDYTWKGLVWGAVLCVLLAVAPALIILRYFFSVDYVPLIFGLTAMLICFVLQRKKHGALGERVRQRMVKFCRLFEAPKKKFNHNKELDKDAKLAEDLQNEDLQNDMIILFFVMFWIAVTIIILGQILSFWEIEWRFSSIDLCKFLVCNLLLCVFHEALHAFAAMVWGKVPWSSIHFGFLSFYFYCHVDRPQKIGAYRIFVLFPLIVTTPIAGLILWLDPSIWSLVFFGITIASCAGDVMILFKIRRVENDKWVQDHQTEMGCYILPEAKMDGD